MSKEGHYCLLSCQSKLITAANQYYMLHDVHGLNPAAQHHTGVRNLEYILVHLTYTIQFDRDHAT